ncbi:MAG: DUF2950 domain-containing protein [Dissulfurispiraceae bacterium]
MKIYQSSIREHSREKKTMFPEMNDKERAALYVCRFLAATVLVMILIVAGMTADASVKQKGFATPEEAVEAFAAAMRSNDDKELLAIFGKDEKTLISSGDPVRDKQRRERFVSSYDLKNSLTKEGDKMVLIIGEKDWPFPIPLVKKGDQWIFDTKAGKEEMLNRRIGENELETVQTMLAIVDAQREYAMADHNGNGLLEYAQKFRSDPGKKNGLFWETKEGEEPSPLGELIASARAQGYSVKGSKNTPVPYHGYIFQMLKKQGKHASGGALNYVVNNNMIGGFAAVAYPAVYGSTGVMTFLVNYEGVVYQKDLGKNTVKTTKAMKAYDPGPSWKKVENGTTK